MAKPDGQKTKKKLLYLLQILGRESDEEHPLSATDLCEKLNDLGVPCERKAIYRDIEALSEFGYEIINARTPKQGYFLAKRELQPAEIRLLMDAIATAPFITEKKTEDLTKKLGGFLSAYQEEHVRSQLLVHGETGRVKFDNEEVYYNIDALHRAIENNKKVQFTYFHKEIKNGKVRRNPGRSFIISPYAMVWNEDKYYLVGNYEKYDNLSNYRIDRMRKVTVLEETARPVSEVSPYKTQFNTADYMRTTFFMFSGEEQTVTLSCDETLVDAMADRFGKLDILEQSDGRFRFQAKVRCGEGFFLWMLRWGDRAVVLEPESVRDEITKRIRDLSDAYKL